MPNKNQQRAEMFEAAKQHENQTMADYVRLLNDEEQNITERDLYQNQAWITASRVLYNANNGSQFDGSDEEVAKYGLEEMGRLNYTFFQVDAPWSNEDSKGLVGYMSDIKERFTDREKLAVNLLYETYEDKDGFLGSPEGWWRAVKGMAQDPTSYAGVSALASLGLKFLGRETAKQGFKLFLRNASGSIMSKTGAAIGATEGMFYGGSDSVMRQEVLADLNDEHMEIKDFLNLETAAGVFLGGTIGVAIPGAGFAYKSAINKWNARPIPTPEVPAREDIVIIGEGKNAQVRIDETKVDVDADNFNFPDLPAKLADDHPLVAQDTQTKYLKSVGEETELFNPEFGHQGKPVYKASRAKIHSKLVFNIVNVAGSRAKEGEQPVVVFLGGGGGSGKSTAVKGAVVGGEVPDKTYVMINPDDIKVELPEYKKIRRKEDYRAALTVHEESSDVAEMALEQAIKEGRHIIIDKTMGNPEKSMALIALLRSKGYQINFLGVTVDPGTAMNRNLGRYYNSGRLPHLQAVVRSHKAFNANAARYLDAADTGSIVDNTGRTLGTVVVKTPEGGVEVIDEKLYNILSQRGQIDDAAKTIRQLRTPAQGGAVHSPGDLGSNPQRGTGEGTQAGGSTDSLAGERLVEVSP